MNKPYPARKNGTFPAKLPQEHESLTEMSGPCVITGTGFFDNEHFPHCSLFHPVPDGKRLF
ncbi:MAG TPA: hypothetical protein DDX86_07795, partial [Akkermansia sp.]|nr:hypothetical protein [Akkermansia sp.]